MAIKELTGGGIGSCDCSPADMVAQVRAAFGAAASGIGAIPAMNLQALRAAELAQGMVSGGRNVAGTGGPAPAVPGASGDLSIV